ncbi:hypothetical protein VTK73DRAFT_4107 [Phialemonium thermophilum]|uniref:CorA-like Mg2+ transporter protein n=1 Tax=Phialemonium thermophilum TaxID=223376 RepID=A0ABR3VBG3_9PEZI
MSGCAAKLANGTRKLRVVEAILAFALEHADCGAATAIRTKGDVEGDSGSAPTYTATESTYDDPAWPRELEGRGSASVVDTDADAAQRILAHHVRLVQHRVRMQAVDNEYVQQRIQVQIAALSHLIAQQDNAMAFETADATRLLSESSRRDSSSMKMLALVAMFFLPGSFVAALFSTPLFDWDAASSGIGLATRPQFGLFWAITVPLTAATFALYFAGLLSQRREHNRREKMATAPVVATSLKSQNTDMGRFE